VGLPPINDKEALTMFELTFIDDAGHRHICYEVDGPDAAGAAEGYEVQEVHYFASCAVGWAVSDNPIDAAAALRKAYSRDLVKGAEFFVAVYRVPGSLARGYSIQNFCPADKDGRPLEGMTKVWEGTIARNEAASQAHNTAAVKRDQTAAEA
jgi:hypothetical protein